MAQGERFNLSYRGRPAAMLEPVSAGQPGPDTDPFLTIARRAVPSPKGRMRHADIGHIFMAVMIIFMEAWVFLTTSMLYWQADETMPSSVSMRRTLRAGQLDSHQLPR